jgi:hypothetical protein
MIGERVLEPVFFNTKMQLLFAFEAPFSLVVCGDELFPQWETHQFWNL